MLVSAVQQREWAINIHLSPPSWASLPCPSHPCRFKILFFKKFFYLFFILGSIYSWFAFPYLLITLKISSWSCCVCLIYKVSVQIFCSLCKSDVCLVFTKLWEFIYSGNRSITRCTFYKYVLPVCGLSFHFLKLSFEEQNFEILIMSNLSDFFSCRIHAFCVLSKIFALHEVTSILCFLPEVL